MGREENDQKKKYLHGYIDARRKEQRIIEQLQELRTSKMFPSLHSDGMPKASGHSDLSGYMAAYDGLINDLEQERMNAVLLYSGIRRKIYEVQNAKEREVLERRYLMGQKWELIALEMGYDYRHILRIHGAGLNNFKMS